MDALDAKGPGLSPLCDCYYVAIRFYFFSARRSSSETAFVVFGFQPDFFLAIAEMVLDIA